MGSVRLALLLGVPVIVGAGLSASLPAGGGLTPAARAEIPAELIPVYQQAARACDGLPWQALAAIGWVESRHAGGQAAVATGDVEPPIVGPAQNGDSGSAAVDDPAQPDGWARPLGPMQILPDAWNDWARLAPGRPAGAVPSAQNAWDSIHSTAAELCRGAPVLPNLVVAVLDHHPRRGYLVEVLTKAADYGLAFRGVPAPALVAGTTGEAVVAAATKMVGAPYVWGAESPAAGFDCSGLVWWAYRQVGAAVPRTTSGQVFAGVEVAPGEQLRLGDLLFTRGGAPVRDLGHVAIYAGGGQAVVAPRTGATVTVKPVDMSRVQAVRRILAPG